MAFVSLVTGASSGLGRALAELLCEEGHIVYTTARRKNLLEEMKKECENFDGEIIPVSGDISEEKFREKLIAQILKKEGKVDYLFNNAGFGKAVFFENQKKEDIEKMFQVNVIACQHLVNLVLPSMKKRNEGKIINIGSITAFRPIPYFTVYNSTKSAIYTFNRSLRYELKDTNVKTTVVLPSRMETEFGEKAYSDYKEKENLVKEFNKIGKNPYAVARKIINEMDKGKEVITPTLKSKFWYFFGRFYFFVDSYIGNFVAPKQKKSLEESGLGK